MKPLSPCRTRRHATMPLARADARARGMRFGLAAVVALVAWPAAVQAQVGTVHRCPGPPVLYTDQLTAADARARGCRPVEGAPVSVVQVPAPRPRPVAGASAASGPAAATAPTGAARAPADSAAQRERDGDARRVLEAELRREEARLAELRREYNNGEPERRGDERNYQRYLDRTAELRASIGRSEADIAAIRRELAKLGS